MRVGISRRLPGGNAVFAGDTANRAKDRATMSGRAVGAASFLAFPLILGGTLALGLVLLPVLGPPTTLSVATGVGLVAVMVAERLWPYRSQWNRAHGDLGTDLLHAAISGIGATRLVRPLVGVFGVVAAGWLSRTLGATLWPTAWPYLAQLALALVVAELPQYWVHRWQHEHDALWRFHATHHSAPRLYFLNAARFHPLDLGLLYFVGYLPLIALGCPEEVLMLFALFDAIFGMLQHSNIDVRLGRWNRVFSMAEVHRWHHSRTIREANTNYGSNLMLWDLVFGTFFLPPDREPPEQIGIADMPDFPTGYLAQLASPFRWRRLERVPPAAERAA
jgi:sterol desaturase/sphingolipid hydroxylase (fatty acid hydroxylase superfamily)